MLSGWNPNANDEVETLAVNGGVIYAGGKFTVVADAGRRFLAAVDMDGGLLPWSPNANAPALTLAVGGSTAYAGGSFTKIDGVVRWFLAGIVTAGGSHWPLPSGGGAGSTVWSVAVDGTTLYSGGGGVLIHGAGATRRYLGAIRTTDGTFTSWDPNPDYPVYEVVPSGSAVYVGGDFRAIGGGVSSYFAKINASTGLVE
jgi:hypothetical protein